MLKMHVTYNGGNDYYKSIELSSVPSGTFDANGNELMSVGITKEAIDDQRDLVTFNYADSTLKLQKGSSIIANSEIIISGSDGEPVDTAVFNETVTVHYIDTVLQQFTIITPSRYTLTLSDVTLVEEEDANGVKTSYLEFMFDPYHYFLIDDDCTIYVSYIAPNGQYKTQELKCQFYEEKILRLPYTKGNNLDLDELYNVIFPSDDVDGVGNLKIERKSFLYDPDMSSTELLIENAISISNIPLSMNDYPNILGQDKIDTQFIEYEKKRAVNRVNDMEKDIYRPVIRNTQTGKIDEVYEIEFNLHFIKRDEDKWKPIPGEYWNGTIKNGNTIGFDENYFPQGLSKSSTSDLLGMLTYTNKDVFNQNKRLTMSFIRISFFDSMNPGDQNLLSYASLYIPSGHLYGNYLKHTSTEGYKSVKMKKTDFTYDIKTDLTGAGTSNEIDSVAGVNASNARDYRMGTTFICSDKLYDPDYRQEGFYLYQWKDYEVGTCPGYIYMKVEFNHAGYGSTVPMMMPYYDRDIDGMAGIRSFENIVTDWNNPDQQYQIRRYKRFSYIRFRYMYDKDNCRHVYYLDDETYGSSVYFKDNRIVLNLYEAKIG